MSDKPVSVASPEVVGLMERIVAVAITGGDTASLKAQLKQLLKQQELDRQDNNGTSKATER